MSEGVAAAPFFIEWLGGIAGVIFYGRFYVQWIVSELKGRSLMPEAFWYMSALGSLLLFIYAVANRSPLGTLSHCFNMVVYGRNFIHIWRRKGTLSRVRNVAVHAGFIAMVLTAISLTVLTWDQSVVCSESGQSFIWLALGVFGQGLFAMRFIVQWIATERSRQSVIPRAFWWLSLVAAGLMSVSFSVQHEWVFATGVTATVLIYARNLWMIYREERH